MEGRGRNVVRCGGDKTGRIRTGGVLGGCLYIGNGSNVIVDLVGRIICYFLLKKYKNWLK
jgi:hypothetical protein